jgi:hypothetical protein
VSNGQVWQIANDIDIGGAIAFTKGEQVTIASTEPNPGRPEYRHTVFSRLTGNWYQLRDEDFEPVAYPPPQPEAPPQHFAPGDAFQQGVIAPPAPFVAPGDAFGQQQYGQPLGAVQPAKPPRTYTVAMSKQDEKRVLWYSTALVSLGSLTVITTFLPWLTVMGFNLGSGWNAMLHRSSSGGFSVYIHGEGVMFFTGFWSIIVGLAIIVGAVMLYRGYTAGVWVARIAGGFGVLFSVLTTMTVSFNGMTAGIGLWLFNIFSLAAMIVAVLSIRAFR